MRVSTAIIGLIMAVAGCRAADSEPEVLESPCVKRWRTTGDASTERLLQNGTSELHVDLNVQVGRFESSYVSFNTRTFNGGVPGPTIKVCPGDKLVVRLRNELGAGAANATNLHLHGLHLSPEGSQDNVFTNVAPGGERVYEYKVGEDHPSGTFWYHPHAHGFVNAQLSGLMAGALVVVDRPDDTPSELADMDEHVMLLQGVCVGCANAYDNLVQAINNDINGGSMMMKSRSADDVDSKGYHGHSGHMDHSGHMGHTSNKSGMENMDHSGHMGHMGHMGHTGMDHSGHANMDNMNHLSHEGHSHRRTQSEGKFPVDLKVHTDAPLGDASLYQVLMNGKLVPQIDLNAGEFARFRFINTIPNSNAEIVAPGCEMHVLALDGIYLKAPVERSVAVIPSGGRADLAIKCTKSGTFHIKTESSSDRNGLLGLENQFRVPSQSIATLQVGDDESDEMELPGSLPVLPEYMKDLTKLNEPVDNDNKYGYEFSVWHDDTGMTYGINAKPFDHKYFNHTMYVDEVQQWELSVGRHMGNMGGHSGAQHGMTHPFHMHGMHYQVTRVDNKLDPDGLLFSVGQWRDTIPLFDSNTQIRFVPRAHMVGRIFTHCHFATHSDNGMAQLVRVEESRR